MKIKTETIIRTVVLIVALINQVLTVMGWNLLPITDDQIAEVISLVFTIGASLWAWWKNNSFTYEARKADEILDSMKKG